MISALVRRFAVDCMRFKHLFSIRRLAAVRRHRAGDNGHFRQGWVEAFDGFWSASPAC